eukprot:gene10356-10514_t
MTKEKDSGLRFQGVLPYPVEDKVDDWGLNAEQQETHVEEFRRMLEAKDAWRREDHDYYTLLRFLRARNYEFDKAIKMWMDTLDWRREYEVDGILDNFLFHEREQFLMAYPQGYHKTDKLGRPIYIQLLGKIDISTLKQITSEERMIKFHIQEYERCGKIIMPICSKLQGRQIDQTFGIMDVKGVGMSHLTGEVKRLMSTLTKFDQDNYPEMLGRICIINAPMVFKAIWSLIKPLLNPRTLSKIQICQTNYTKDLLEWVDAENLPEWLGGKSKGTLLDDVGPWSDPEVLRKMEGQLPVAYKTLKRMTSLNGQVEAPLLEEADGYRSPRQRNLLERLSALEDLYGQQMQRLKGYMPANAYSRLQGHMRPRAGIGAGAGAGAGVLQRLELLEEGMELLMRAQELSWQAEEQRRRDRGVEDNDAYDAYAIWD